MCVMGAFISGMFGGPSYGAVSGAWQTTTDLGYRPGARSPVLRQEWDLERQRVMNMGYNAFEAEHMAGQRTEIRTAKAKKKAARLKLKVSGTADGLRPLGFLF